MQIEISIRVVSTPETIIGRHLAAIARMRRLEERVRQLERLISKLRE